MMRLQLLVAAVVAVAACKPTVPNSEHRELLAKYFGKDVDVRVVNRIIAEEARALGISSKQHFKHCILDDVDLEGKAQFERAADQFERMLPRLRFKSVKTAMQVLKVKTPKFYGEITDMYKNTISELGREASIYFVNLKFTLLETLVDYVNASDKAEIAEVYVHAIKQLYAEYRAMSKAAKVDFEKNTCIYTVMRIYDTAGKRKGQFSAAKKMFDKIVDEY